VERVAQVHLQGLGAPPAVLEGAAIFLDAVMVASRAGEPVIRHLDPERYSHVAGLAFDGVRRSRVYLHENPLRRRTVDAADRYPMGRWVVDNRNVESATTTLVVEGLGDRAVLPAIFCPATGESVRFEGIVPDGAALVLSPTHGATLAGRQIDDWISTARGGHLDFVACDRAVWVVETPAARTRFDGDLESLAVPAAQTRRDTPRAPAGQSEWVFMVAEGTFDVSESDFSVFVTPREPIGVWDGDPAFDASVYDFPASARTSMAWNERIPCAFKLLLPTAVPRRQADGGVQWQAPDVGRLATVMSRFRAAGVRAFVDTAPDVWILGDSLLRTANAADGEGVTVNSTAVRDGDSDLFVSFDPQPAAPVPSER
jgi:hypothetical protein